GMLTPFAAADSVTPVTVKDNTLYQDVTGSLSNGAGLHFFAGLKSNGEIKRGLIAFDVAASIPAGSTITSVDLTLNLSRTNAPAGVVSLHRALADWGEGASMAGGGEGAGGPAEPGDATWLHTFFSASFWTNPGGDFDATASASLLVDQEAFYTWTSTPALVADVQAWLDTPAADFGWVVVGDESGGHSDKRFDTHEEPDPLLRPQLAIVFTPPAPCALLGDINEDGVIDGDDEPGFVRAKLGAAPAAGENQACADYGTGTIAGDIALFVAGLLN
ncbi:MAG: DNRLRE domain-containing protein, partial [Phycisphaerae bacterium]